MKIKMITKGIPVYIEYDYIDKEPCIVAVTVDNDQDIWELLSKYVRDSLETRFNNMVF